ncbi:BMP family ABC transporter substrate-binding protein [Mycoplasmopsis mucosicanis]|uniref:BMP family ABC transporter substrate-binding protein n=1 Tax=Mycoplasmopsis mucosicanis TaxID=458208 RepID=A0A507SR18_9BACT|nr:BMP family ABC transporter substrate-binding protein [Mycoplasmopsis mucosicanis]TQC54227.1 BMP family ABC transporter substrate-binding protein [Mycoplasmopsis mucosicanis]
MKHKLLLSLGASSVLGLVPAVTVACAVRAYDHPLAPSVATANVVLNDKFNLTDEQAKEAPSIVLINDGGDINDKSFNQSAWEGVLNFTRKQNKYPISKIGVQDVKNGEYVKAYQAALDSKFKIWVAPGFLHAKHLKSFFSNPENVKKFKENGSKIIGADYASGLDLKSHYQDFNVREGAWIAGYAAAMFLSNEAEAKDRTFTSFGGGNFAGVTDFIEGFYKGVWYWNSQQTDENKKVHSTEANVNLSTGFNATEPKMATAVQQSTASGAKLILPVAGPATFVVLDDPTFTSQNKYIVGVDTDQAQATEKGKNRFFTSILKNLSQSTYDIVGLLATTPTSNNWEELWKSIEGKLGVDKQLDSEIDSDKHKTNDRVLKGGIDEKWVDVSSTYIDGDKKTLAEQALVKAKALFEELKKAKDTDPTEMYKTLLSKKAKKGSTDYSTSETKEKPAAVSVIEELAKELLIKR